MGFYIGRYKNIERISYNLEVVTPMFLGGANTAKAELRAPSIKGMLRFWWRASCGIADLTEMKEKESEIFGSTEEKSKVTISIETKGDSISNDLFKGKTFKPKGKSFTANILHYLGFGAVIYDKNVNGKQRVDKSYITVKSKFNLQLSTLDSHSIEVEQALKYFITFGGLGAKSRNGFGSIYCEELILEKLLKSDNELLNYTAFSKYSKIIKFQKTNSWEDALSDAGLAYKDGRLSLERKHSFEKRGLIAKPIIAKNENIPKDIAEGRHAKPYFLHVNKLQSGKYQGQILFMPYQYKDNFNDYMSACEDMNQKIEELAGGNKWQ